MQTQVKVQMDERDSQGRPPPQNPLQAPGVQMMPQSNYAGPPQVLLVLSSYIHLQKNLP